MLKFLPNNKRAVSAIIATVLLIMLTLVVVGVVWAIVNNIVRENISQTESCGILNEVELNPRYTCYNQTSGNDELWFYIEVGEIEKLEDIYVSISGQVTGSSFKITDDPAELYYYNRTPAGTSIPEKGSGQGYIYVLPSSFTTAPDRITLAPIINGKQCDVSSSISEFDACSSLA